MANGNKPNKMLDNPLMWLIIICALFAAWFLVIPPIAGLVLLFMFCKELKELNQEKENIKKEKKEVEAIRDHFTEETFLELRNNIEDAESKLQKQNDKIKKSAYLYKSVRAYIEKFTAIEPSSKEVAEIEKLISELEIEDYLNPTAEIKLHNTDVKDLRKQYREINKNIDFVLNEYEKRYNSKANLAIYRLMVLALRSELQNVLYTMKFGRLEDAENAIAEIADKYIKIAADGNQSIAPTITKFVIQTKSLFIDAARVEYEYYVRKERMKEEQKAIREQMKQEAEERRKLEEEKKKVEAEEAKYITEMQKLQAQMSEADGERSQKLADRVAELEALLNKVNEKKETITKLQNGKAGYVYVISNLGSFGDHVFKIGMTRRQEPQERIDELGDASVPFSFDVHSFIFSEDAPALETAIHNRLNANRLNKVNLRKEFFDISLDELEALVYELDPTASFNRTMAAEQYRQSLSMKEAVAPIDLDEDVDDE